MPEHIRSYRLLALCVLSVLLAAPAARAEYYALLVGVSGYPSLPESLRLAGPHNDVALIAARLRRLGFADRNLAILADGLPGARTPTREAIMGALRRLAARVGPEDFVYLHFSGHGSQVPRRGHDGDESDGLDEVFLPYDVGAWNGRDGKVENAIVDDELNRALGAIVAKGSFLWSVFDTCHSGTLSRNFGEDEQKARFVPPEILGVPLAAIRARPARAASGPSRTIVADVRKHAMPAGRYVEFFASQEYEKAPEYALPAGSPERKPYGLFSFILAGALERGLDKSYRQIAQDILQNYDLIGLRSTTPLFGGSRLDDPVLRIGKRAPLRQWPVTRTGRHLVMAAGSIHQLGPGSVFALFPAASAAEAALLGYAEIRAQGPLESELRPTARGQVPAVAATNLPRNAFARPVDLRPPRMLRIAEPVLDGAPPSRARALRALFDAAAAAGAGGARIAWVAPDRPADLRLVAEKDRFWAMVPQSEGVHRRRAFAYAASGAGRAREMAAVIRTVARYRYLLELDERTPPLSGAGLDAVFHVTGASSGAGSRPLGANDRLSHGDRLALTLTNRGAHPLDVTVLSLGADLGVAAVFPTLDRYNRIPVGGTLRLALRVDAADAGALPPGTASERLLLLAAQARPGRALADFTFLGAPSGMGAWIVAGPDDPVVARTLPRQPAASRASAAAAADQDLVAELMSWTVVPPPAR